ncbi:hypothetical protein CH063_03620 [Colletotrichum higginsianum]|uniref:Uncharacterized protein n=3 Tax=Colletotrichum destructivum species complex TaxID=2707350 RepID=H1VZ22_COLHI|nr:hypothetical protein CH63R_09214 [Colletotrichum higginsianum IMI 349063]OBR07693.1 hypothetical protein CH63R_09214 [Colletotrichum higginsianum IMI 349063]TIC91735.1 hypothetical protein CH35J_010618 [Colletotrichum higginsianum]GJC98211.1 hypothetical protein ColKHC_07037 [Colletotrichum higginsianum]CCF45484.1 hypothetical protein CH063_03620 [Colletotrichum higginsianum]
MQLSFLLLPLLSLTALAHDGEGRNRNSTEAQCKRFLRGEKLVKIASNDTLLAEITNNNATKIDFIKKKAAEIQPRLDQAKQNATLMTACEQVRAVQHENGQCRFMHRMDKLQKLVANETALNQVTNNNATKAQKLKDWAQKGMTKLTELQGNQTLLQYCSARDTKGQCRQMKKLNKLVALSKNDTALNEKFNGNATKIEMFKAKAAKKEVKLNEMMNNSTLMGVCQQIKAGKGGKNGANNNSQNGIDSGAAGVRAAGALSVAAVVSVVVGLLM